MKKVLALVMVFSMVGFASAALQIEVADGKAMVTGQLDADIFVILSAGDGAVLSNFALGGSAPAASYMAAGAADFAGLEVPVPAGFEGEGWFLGAFPGEAYKAGAQLVADLAGFSMTQITRTEVETITEGCEPGWWKERTWTKIYDVVVGGLSLSTLSAAYDNPVLVQTIAAGEKLVSAEFQDGPCVPEPLTLSLLGLGALVLRRRS